jgi:hypothetical protein
MKFDGGMQLALDAAGGRSALARRMSLPRQNVKWATCPKDKLFDVARAAGVEPEKIRPDLVDWIRIERQRLLLERARAKFGLSGPAKITTPDTPMPAIVEVFELGLTVAALRFAAQERGLQLHQVLKGADQPTQSARAYGMALAHVVGRVSSTSVAMVVGCSRQNVENAAHRYERARDGDDEAEGGRVIERGRVRRAKAANDDLWAAERRFLEELSK